MRCQRARYLIASSRLGAASRRLERHLEGCEGCRREQAAYEALDRGLAALPMTAPISPAFEGRVVRAVRAAADVPAVGRGGWWLGVPALAGAAALALALRASVSPPVQPSTAPQLGALALPAADLTPAHVGWDAPDHRRSLRSVPSQPPPELAARPDLFVDLPMLRNLERLEHFEAIQTTTLDDDPGDGTSNG